MTNERRALRGPPPSKAPDNPSNCVEFVNEDGSRYAWSESNIQYELVADKAGEKASFTTLRARLDKAVIMTLERARDAMCRGCEADDHGCVGNRCRAQPIRVLIIEHERGA